MKGISHQMSDNIKKVILCKYGEVALKGANRRTFESAMLKDIARRARRYGDFDIYTAQSTVYIEPKEGAVVDLEGLKNSVSRVFGISAYCESAVSEKNIDAIRHTAAAYLPPLLRGVATFRAEAKRADKTFPIKSPELAAEVGGVVLSSVPGIKVNLDNPDITVRVEIRERGAYIHAGQTRGAGGMPIGTGGRAMLLLSGGIDSPVAGFMMMRRGVTVDAVHFESFPYTGEQAKEKVLTLARILCGWCNTMKVRIISVTRIQEELRAKCDESYFTLLLRRFMMRLAERAAREAGAGALITGESLGQVASQTMDALVVTDDATSMPVFRPCIGMDKEDIIKISREIDAFETSILPYEDCCTIFTPQHPKTRPTLERVLEQEARVDVDALLEEAWATRQLITVSEDF